MEFNMYLSKHSWNTQFSSPNIHQDGSPQVSHVSYRSFSALKYIALLCYLFIENLLFKLLEKNCVP